jgi:hypothetical protein
MRERVRADDGRRELGRLFASLDVGPPIFCQVLVDDSDQDEEKGEKSNKVEEGSSLIGIVAHGQCEAIQSLDEEGNGKEKEEAIFGVLPEPQEEQAGDQRNHRNGAQKDKIHISLTRRPK